MAWLAEELIPGIKLYYYNVPDTEDLVQESTGEKGFVPVQERHTECDELSSYRSIRALML